MKSEKNSDFDLEISKKELKSCFNFLNDLEVGKSGEELVKDILSSNDLRVEVKRDDWVTRGSHNLAIEITCRGKPSGISITKSDYWAHIIGGSFILIFPVDFLKETCNSLKNNPKYIKRVGDRDADGVPVSEVVLLPWNELITLFKAYETKKKG